MLSEICAPVFIFLTGLSAWLYSQKHTAGETSVFLLKRGLFLVLLEITFVCFAWNAEFPPKSLWLQVIWYIGICMIVLAGLLHFKRGWLIVLGVAVVAGHNLLDNVTVGPESPFFIPWSILHQRVFIDITEFTRARTMYPVLPWIGVIVLGWAIGPWFGKDMAPNERISRLVKLGSGLLVAFVFFRYLNVYSEKPWVQTGDALRTFMSFMSAKKYPPSLMFLMPTLGLGLLLLALFEKLQDRWSTATLAIYGGGHRCSSICCTCMCSRPCTWYRSPFGAPIKGRTTDSMTCRWCGCGVRFSACCCSSRHAGSPLSNSDVATSRSSSICEPANGVPRSAGHLTDPEFCGVTL